MTEELFSMTFNPNSLSATSFLQNWPQKSEHKSNITKPVYDIVILPCINFRPFIPQFYVAELPSLGCPTIQRLKRIELEKTAPRGATLVKSIHATPELAKEKSSRNLLTVYHNELNLTKIYLDFIVVFGNEINSSMPDSNQGGRWLFSYFYSIKKRMLC